MSTVAKLPANISTAIATAIATTIANVVQASPQQVIAAVQLLDEGATVPFIARYRKEITGGLDDTQLRNLEERLIYLRELEDRRATVLSSIEEQGQLTDELKKDILAADTKTRLEDLYAPYKKKRRTKAQIAREAGIEPLADALLDTPTLTPETEATAYLNAEAGFADVPAVLEGAKQILMERFAEDAELIGQLREWLWHEGVVSSRVAPDKEQAGEKFKDYFEYVEPIKKIPSHRALALFRGRNEGMLFLNIDAEFPEGTRHPAELKIARRFNVEDNGRAADKWLNDTVRWAWKVKIALKLELDLFSQLRDMAEEEAIRVFGMNLRDLLLAAPAGARATIGLDPGLRTGVKVAVVDHTGKLLNHATIYPHAPQKKWDEAIAVLAKLAKQHDAELLSIGNGTASRETDQLAAELISKHPELKLNKIMVSEAGASVYSASEFAAKEFPDIDVSIRGAVSIARRLQDPLAELVKIEPKAIGVGQYQHDVSQFKLSRSLNSVVEDCVNSVGVDLNTASAPLLSRVAGLSESVANTLVEYRDQHGEFKNRQALLDVPRLGPKAFEQCAGFLRIRNGDNPLDASAVHPEAYTVVKAMLSGRPASELIGNKVEVRQLDPQRYVSEQFGLPTIQDIIAELEKPGRDPRPEFKTANFKDGVEKIGDLEPGMTLEGVITNVTNFGAFVDVGVHQDGLVHISMLADKFVQDPREVVKAGDVVKVKVMEVDVQRKRIGLSMRLQQAAEKPAVAKSKKSSHTATNKQQQQKSKSSNQRHNSGAKSQPKGAMAQAFAALK